MLNDPGAATDADADAEEDADFQPSSFDLLHGLDVIEWPAVADDAAVGGPVKRDGVVPEPSKPDSDVRDL